MFPGPKHRQAWKEKPKLACAFTVTGIAGWLQAVAMLAFLVIPKTPQKVSGYSKKREHQACLMLRRQ